MFLFYVQNIARINHGFVGLVVILFTLTKLYDISSTNFRSWNLLIFFFQRENLSALKQMFPCVISLVLVEKSYWYPHENATVRKLFSLSFLPQQAHIVHLTMRHHLFLEFWLVDTDLLLTDVTTVLQLASKMYASQVQEEAKGWVYNCHINTLSIGKTPMRPSMWYYLPMCWSRKFHKTFLSLT